MKQNNILKYFTAAMFILNGLIPFIAGYFIPLSYSFEYLLFILLGIAMIIKFPSMMQTVTFVLLALSELVSVFYGISYLFYSTDGIWVIVLNFITAALYVYLAYASYKISHEMPVRFARSSLWFLPVVILAAVTALIEAVDIFRAVDYVEWYYAEGYLDGDAYFDKAEAIASGAVWAARTAFGILGLLLVCLGLKNSAKAIENNDEESDLV